MGSSLTRPSFLKGPLFGVFFSFVCFLMAIFAAYGKSWARDWIWATAMTCVTPLAGCQPWASTATQAVAVGFFFFFLGPHLRHVEVQRLGVKSELQLPICTIATATPDLSCPCNLLQLTAAPDPWTPWVRPGIEPESPWTLVGFVTTESWGELPCLHF